MRHFNNMRDVVELGHSTPRHVRLTPEISAKAFNAFRLQSLTKEEAVFFLPRGVLRGGRSSLSSLSLYVSSDDFLFVFAFLGLLLVRAIGGSRVVLLRFHDVQCLLPLRRHSSVK